MTLPTIAQPPAPTALAEMEARKDAAYLERNQVVAALAKAYPSGVARTAIEGWSEDWHGCVYIDLPTGQASWHFHDSQAYLFAGLPAYAGKWDGHDTPEKYRRLAALQPVQQPGAEPFAHICVLPTKDAGPTKFFTAPSDPRGFPVYLAAPAQRQPLSDEQIDSLTFQFLTAELGPTAYDRAIARAIEAAHNITAAPAAQKGEKL